MPGVLTYDDIVLELANNRLISGGDAKYVEACSYDMRVGTIFREGLPIRGAQGQAILQPGDIVSLFTLEELDLPADIAATAFAMNAMSSQGILVLNPGHVDPGYKGPLTVRAINLRATPKAIDLGTRIFTVVFERLPKATGKPYGPIPGDREERELKFNSIDVEQNPHSMARLVMLGKDRPLMTGDEVDRRIRDHWTTKATLIGTIAGLLVAGIAAIFAIIGVYRAEPPKTTQQNVNAFSASPSPSLEPAQNSNAHPTVRSDKIKSRNR
jgi:dUTPase